MWTGGIRVTATVIHQTCVYEVRRNEERCTRQWGGRCGELTGTRGIRCCGSVGVSRFTNADDRIACSIVRAECIQIAATICHLAAIYKRHKTTEEILSNHPERGQLATLLYLCMTHQRLALCWWIRSCRYTQLHWFLHHVSTRHSNHNRRCSLGTHLQIADEAKMN